MEDILYPEGSNVAVVDGEVVPVGARRLTPGEVLCQLKSIVSQPYMGKDVNKIGMTLLEAAFLAAAEKAAEGDTDALEKIMNRICGKPIQQVVSATGTLKEFLDAVVRTESGPAADIDPLSS